MEKKKKSTKKIIIISVILVILVGVTAFFIFGNFMRADKSPFGKNNFPINDSERGGNFQPLNETTKNQITSFFESSPSSSEVEDYCNQNKQYCLYYCMDMKGNNEICNTLMNNTQTPPGGEPPQ